MTIVNSGRIPDFQKVTITNVAAWSIKFTLTEIILTHEKSSETRSEVECFQFFLSVSK